MIQNYLKHLESIISPKPLTMIDVQNLGINYNLHAHKEDLEKSNKSNLLLLNKSPTNVSDKKSLSIISPRSNILAEGKAKTSSNFYEEEHRHTGKFHNNCDDVSCLKDIIKEEKKKNMNLRHELGELNKTLDGLNKKEEELIKVIHGLKLEKEINSKYILKMEAMIVNLNKKEKPKKVGHLKTDSASVVPTTQVNHDEIEKIILSQREELENLRVFKNQIYKISKSYEEVNHNIMDSLKDINSLFLELNFQLYEKTKNKFDIKFIEKVANNFENIMVNVDKLIRTKQDEFNYLIDEKERENKILNEEIIISKNNTDILKQERVNDQKLIEELETQNLILVAKTEEMTKIFNSLENDKNLKQETTKRNVKKKTEPVKNSIEKSIQKLKNNLNMKEHSNITLIENLKNYHK